jgi:hypothetical protein
VDRDRLAARLREVGVAEPEDVAAWVSGGDRDELARALLLHTLWVHEIDAWRDEPQRIVNSIGKLADGEFFSDAGHAFGRLMQAGADVDDVRLVARAVAYAAVFGTLYSLEDPCRVGEVDDLEELAGEEAFERLSAGALHESLLTADPSGREGRPAG